MKRRLQDRPDLPLAVLVTALAITFIVRYCTVAHHLDMGHDIANYLSTMNTLFGQDASGFGLNRPPLIGVILKPFAFVFGHLAGAKVLGVLVSVGLGVPFYLLAKRLCRPWLAVAATLLFVLTPDYSDLLTWGYLTMFGLLFTLFALYFLLLTLENPSKMKVFLTAASISLIVGFHQLSLVFFVFLLALVLTALAVSNRQRLIASYKPVLAAMAVAVVLSLPYLPVYLRLVHWQATTASSQSVSITPLAQIQADLSFGIGVSFVPWLLGMIILPSVLGIIALKWTWEQDKRAATTLAVVLLYSLVLVLLMLPPPFAELNRRAHYFLYFPLWLLVGVFLSRLWSWQTAHASAMRQWLPRLSSVVIILVLLSTTSFLSLRQLHRSLDFYNYLDDSRWNAINWISDNATEQGSIVVYPETLGWWIEAEGGRNTANVTDRETVPLTYLRERSLFAERILSGNEGIDNGNLRLGTTYPYAGVPGSPTLSAYAGGSFRDLMMFDDSSTSLTMETGDNYTLAAATREASTAAGDADSIALAASYRLDGLTVLQTARLDRGGRTATVRYQFGGGTATQIHIPLFFSFAPESVAIDQDQHSIKVVQALQSVTEPVTTRISIDTDGAVLEIGSGNDSRLDLSFTGLAGEAEITFTFLVTGPKLNSNTDVTHYEVPRLLEEPALEHLPTVSYLAVDLKPAPCAAAELPPAIEEWLTACPYYEMVYSEGDIRIYQVDYSRLP